MDRAIEAEDLYFQREGEGCGIDATTNDEEALYQWWLNVLNSRAERLDIGHIYT